MAYLRHIVRKYRRFLLFLLGSALTVAWLLLFWHGPEILDRNVWNRLTPGEQADAVNSLRTVLVLMIVAVGSLGALAFTGRTFRLSQETQLSSRYALAVEQLGSEQRDMRISGIYALERIMADSPHDHETIVEVLTTFIREHQSSALAERADGVRRRAPAADRTEGEERPVRPDADVQVALTVLGRRPRRREPSALNLSEANLRGASLVRLQLEGANLTRANLEGADLTRVQMDGVNLMEANLEGANLTQAQLPHAILARARCRGANLKEGRMEGTNLGEADLRNTMPTWANLQDANLHRAQLDGADLTWANLRGARLADVQGLSGEQLGRAYTDDETVLPTSLDAAG
jgi:hypothetical protein